MYNYKFKKLKMYIVNWIDVFFDILKICRYSLFNLIIKQELYSEELTIVTGSDFTHYKSLINLLDTLIKFESRSRLVVYDLGLSEKQKKSFKKKI